MVQSILKHPYWEPPISESEMAIKIYNRWTRAALKTYRHSQEVRYQEGRISKAEYEASLVYKVEEISPESVSALREWFETTYWKPKSKKHVRFAENTEVLVVPGCQAVSSCAGMDVQSQDQPSPNTPEQAHTGGSAQKRKEGLCPWIYLNGAGRLPQVSSPSSVMTSQLVCPISRSAPWLG